MTDVKLQTPSDLARLIKNARVQRNLTQQDIADAVGITRQSVARLERGNGGASFDTVLLILDHLGIHLDATTDRLPAAPASAATGGAAQAAADALTRRITPLIDASMLEVLGSFPQIDTAGILTQLEAKLDPATLASIREATRELTERRTIPGAVLITPPRAVETGSPDTVQAQADAGSDASGGIR